MEHPRPQPYSLSTDTFQHQEITLQLWQPKNPMTPISRQNFVDFCIFTLNASQSKVPVSRTICKWLEAKQGFDWKTTFENYKKAGGNHNLSQEERLTIISRFRGVKKHETSFERIEGRKITDEEILAFFDEQMTDELLGTRPVDKDIALPDLILTNFNNLSWSELMSKCKSYIEQHR